MKKKKLNEISRLLNGYAFKSSKYVQSGLRVIRIANVQDGYLSDSEPCFYPIETTTELEQFLLKPHDLLMSLTGNVGRVAFIEKEYLPAGLNQRVECIRPFKEADKEYLYYFFRSPMFQREALKASHGSAQLNLSTVWLANFYVVYPDEEKRKTAVNTLRTIDNLIREKRNQLIKLDSLVKSRFNEIFGDVLTNDKGYKTCAFGEYVIQMNIGPFGSALKNDVFVPENKGYCMVYEQKHAIDKDMNVSARYVDETTYKALKRFEVGPGDIIVSCRGTIGECFLIPEGSPNGIIHPSLMMIKPKSEVNHKFLVFLLERILAEQTQDGSGVKMAIKAKDLSKIQTIHPSRELQDSFISFVELVDKSRFVCHSRNFL